MTHEILKKNVSDMIHVVLSNRKDISDVTFNNNFFYQVQRKILLYTTKHLRNINIKN